VIFIALLAITIVHLNAVRGENDGDRGSWSSSPRVELVYIPKKEITRLNHDLRIEA